ncbi:MAG: sigma-70 family RNA polymerase sigma factor [Polyangiaceae bacterium]
MADTDLLSAPFEQNRDHLRGVAFRMLGSLSEAEDAVQEAWLRLTRFDTGGVDNPRAWLTTVVARVCLDMLRSRKSRREDALDDEAPPEPVPTHGGPVDPEEENMLASSVGLALLVVLQTLAPAERLAFVLHDLFAVSFEEIGPIVGRTPEAARQLASRARRRVQGASPAPGSAVAEQRRVVEAFLSAVRGGDMTALLEVLDPDVVLRLDPSMVPAGGTPEIRGAQAVAKRAAAGGARAAQPALVDGEVGVVVAPRGKLLMVLRFTIADGRIALMESIADPARVADMELATLG